MTGTTPEVAQKQKLETREDRREFLRFLIAQRDGSGEIANLARRMLASKAGVEDTLAYFSSADWREMIRRRRWRGVDAEVLMRAWAAWARERGVEPEPPEETYELRVAFASWLYDDKYEEDSAAGSIARQLHAESLGYHVIRNHPARTWADCAAKRGWKVDVSALMAVWREFQEANDG